MSEKFLIDFKSSRLKNKKKFPNSIVISSIIIRIINDCGLFRLSIRTFK